MEKGFNGRPDTTYKVCPHYVSTAKCTFKDWSSTYKTCQQIKTKEDIPEGLPLVLKHEITTSKFTIKIQQPKLPNGKIIGYNLELLVCKMTNPSCPIMVHCDEYDHLDNRFGVQTDGKTIHAPILYTFDSLEPNNQYLARVVAYNAVGKSPAAELVVITRPTLENYQQMDINIDHGSHYVLVKANKDICPYQGPIEYQASIKKLSWNSFADQASRKSFTYDLENSKSSSVIQFDRLDSDARYRVCIKEKLIAKDSVCKSQCSLEERCTEIVTQCEPIPRPLKIPNLVPFKEGSNDDFNPFTQVFQTCFSYCNAARWNFI